MELTLYFDGSGGRPATYGFVVYAGDARLAHGYGTVDGPGTNNVAEFTALVRGLERLVANGLTDCRLLVRGDSQLVTNQRVKDPKLVPLRDQARALAKKFAGVRFEHVERAKNSEADTLTRLAREGKRGHVSKCDDPELLARLKSGAAPEEAAPLRPIELTVAGVPGAGAAVLRDPETTLFSEGWSFGKDAGPHIACYEAILKAIQFLSSLKETRWDILVRSDVDLVVKQIAGRYKVGAALYELFSRVQREARRIGSLRAAAAEPGSEDLKEAKRLARVTRRPGSPGSP